MIISNILAVIAHLTRELPIPDSNKFLYGHHTLQAIGQTQLTNKYYFIPLDLLIFYLQIALFTSQYSSKKHKTIRSSLVDTEFDGLQGETIALKIPIISALHLPFPSIEELKQEEETATSRQQRSGGGGGNNNNNDNDNNGNDDNDEGLLASQAIYGSINSNLDDEEDTLL